MRSISTFGLAVCVALVSNTTWARTVYKCSGSGSVVQYLERPIAGLTCKAISTNGQPPRSAMPVPAPSSAKVPPSTSKAAPNAPASNTNKTLSAALSDEECQRIQAAADLLSSGKRIHETDTNGERRQLSEEERQQKLQQYQDMRKNGCS